MANNPEITILLDFYGDLLTEKQREVMDFYYNSDFSLAEIAENMEVYDKKTGLSRNPTRQAVRDTIKRSEALLYEMEQKLGLVERFGKIEETMKLISIASLGISMLNSKAGGNREIGRLAAEIKSLASLMEE